MRLISGPFERLPYVARVVWAVSSSLAQEIHHEWKRNLLKNRSDLPLEQLDRTSQLMDLAIPDACIDGYEDLVSGLTLPDENDRHVLAAAIRCGADVIVTFNLKDFPSCHLAPYGIEAQHPDEFVENLFHLDSAAVVAAAQSQRRQLKTPTVEVDKYLGFLQRQGLVESVKALGNYRAIL
jgi:predicted nucleic acid-binding protein